MIDQYYSPGDNRLQVSKVSIFEKFFPWKQNLKNPLHFPWPPNPKQTK